MKKKVLAILLACTMTAGLAACGSTAAAPAEESAAVTEEASETEEVNEEAPAEEAAAGPVTLNVTTTYAGNDGGAVTYQKYLAQYQDETGNTINDASGTADEAFKARVLADFEVGSEPDVLFYFNGPDSNSFVGADKVVSVDDIRAEFPDYASNMKDDMLGASPIDGKNYSIPVNGYWEAMYVNKEVCEAAGVEIPGADTTWEEFMDICQKIKDAGYSPIAASLAQVPHYWFEYSIFNYTSVKTHCVLPESTTDANGKAWIDGITDVKDLYEKGYFPDNTLSATDDETFQMFIDGKAAFLVDGSWKAGGIAEKTDNIDNFTVTYVPGQGDRKSTDMIGGLSSGYYITKKAWEDPEKREAAVKFVEYMTSDEAVSEFALVSATALKNGATVDESTLNSLQKDCLTLCAGATGIAAAVQDLVPQPCRVPVFDGMPNLVTGKADIAESVQEVLDLIAEQ
ncbi:MAG: extracellular solute-binding protein [Lachnospiraceae bacterium]